MTILAKIVVFPFLFSAYYSLIVSIGILIKIIVGLPAWLISKRFRATPHILTILEASLLLILSLTGFYFYWRHAGWTYPDLYIWNNTILVGIMMLGLVLKLPSLSTNNPFFRRTAWLVYGIPISLMVVLPVGIFAPELMSQTMVKWSTVGGLALLGVDGLVAFISILPQMRRFHSIELHIKEVGDRIGEFQPVVALLSGNKAGAELDRILKVAQQWHAAALRSLRANDLQGAENQIVISEIELSEITRRIGGEQGAWVQEIRKERLRDLDDELDKLIATYNERQLQTNRLIELRNEVTQLTELESQEPTAEMADQYRKLSDGIGELGAALRFQDNLGRELDGFEIELASHASIAELGRVLNLDTSGLQRTVAEASEYLQRVRMRDYRAMNELLKLVQDIRDRAMQANLSRNELLAKIAAKWLRKEYVDGAVVVYCPKYCKTDEAARGAIELECNKLDQDSPSLAIIGSLLAPQGDGRLSFQKQIHRPIDRSVFFVSGVKAGKGVLSLRSDDVGLTRVADDIQVRVVPTRTDLVKESSLWAAPTGAVILLAALYAGEDVQTFAPIAASAGAALGFMIFGFRYMTGLRPYR